MENQLIRHEKGIFSMPNEACIHFKYSQQSKKYIILRRDGKGVVFQNEKSDKSKTISVNSPFYFEIFLDKYEQVYVFN